MEAAAEPISSSFENEHSNISNSNNEGSRADRKTLHYFFSRADRTKDASTSAPEPSFNPPAPNYNLLRHALDQQVTGRLHPWAISRAHAAAAHSYHEASFIDAHPWRTPVLGTSHSFPPSGCIQCAQFDSTGELLVTGGEDGTILVHSGEALQQAAWQNNSDPEDSTNKTLRSSDGGGSSEGTHTSVFNRGGSNLPKVDPMLALRSGLSTVDYLKWNPADQNVIAVSSRLTKSVNIYDLQHTQGRPKQTLHLPSNCAGGNAGDISFFNSGGGGGAQGLPGGAYALLVGGPSGQVFVWDTRMSGPPATTLQSTRGGTVTSVALIENDQAVIAGTQQGDIKAWDLRGGSGGALRFGGIIHHHPILSCTDLRTALAAVPGLLAQAGSVPTCSIQSMALSPVAPYRAGFHLGCGWSGVLDLRSRRVTHVHAPSQPLVDEQPTAADGARAMVMWTQMAAPTLRRKACWSADGRRFAVPSRHRDSLLLLDFSEGKHAGCYALGADGTEEDEDDEDGTFKERRLLELARRSVNEDFRENPRSNSNGRNEDQHLHGEDQATRASLERSGYNSWQRKKRRNPSAVEVSLSQAAICAASMPDPGSTNGGEVIVAAGAHSQLSLVRPG